MAMETITTTDKSKRDQMFSEFRKSEDPLERQVVKFSSNEPVLADGKQTFDGALKADGTIKQHSRGRSRPVYISNWSVAYPTS